MATRNTIVIVDDTVFSKVYDYSAGPTKVWEESIESKQIIEIGRKRNLMMKKEFSLTLESKNNLNRKWDLIITPKRVI